MTQSTNNTYFDLHTSGIGYLNRIREVSVRKGNPFMAVTVAALHGSSDKVEYTYIDCKVAGGEAERLIRRCQQAENSGRKVLVGFRIGDIWVETFTYDRGEKLGQTGASIKGRLLYISWIKIDGENVYQVPDKESGNSVDANPQSNQHAQDQGYEEAKPRPAARTYASGRTPYGHSNRPMATRLNQAF
ncbi:STY4534 family ICE replication protein [Pseudomonas capsici]|uniref:STY4534 family ICE replication protein n=1 Tax=Pseudomonas capsici TaxID=2810614 RepID=UPI0021F13C43|nr:STY4534 family ICE replication protein [Pseudomonas capsici]MCV4286431.1 STY4534 family ICE replication protein [Pseudomonas capsici]